MRNKSFFLSLVTILFSSSFSIAQEREGETYRITDYGSVQEIQPYINALNAANMQYHRLKNQRHTIVFEKGVKVELFSCVELISIGRNINLDDYPDSFPTAREVPEFFLGPNNYILEQHKNISK